MYQLQVHQVHFPGIGSQSCFPVYLYQVHPQVHRYIVSVTLGRDVPVYLKMYLR